MIARVAHTALAVWRFLQFSPHRAKIVCGGDHWKENDEKTSQRKQALRRCQPTAKPATAGAPPEPIGRQCQKNPREVEQQFHREKLAGGCVLSEPKSPE